ncbi:hypothetical protein E2562_010276 [Oryza meyeriana var. granulata]|uniref:Uncharacterized protein n=1 Tax=Oryza meyeriana var. granulata TaxID=110450 RepID=A0A6G1EJU3_9ORYZ|nr:hypothetical protein E2562_010276 [Oryza meyeriana var. granulata]
MAASSLHCHSVLTILLILFLALSSSVSVLQARMVPSDDHDAAKPVARAVGTVPSSRDSLAFMAPPMPPPAPAGTAPEMTAVGKRWGGKVQLQGSVPSPGIGN